MAAAGAETGVASARRLSLFDCVAIGVNGIVGSGIFLLPGRLAAEAGSASILAFLVCGVLCGLIALCFAEAAGTFDRSGGPYVYARAAFGEPAGFAVGWMALATGTLGASAVARGFAQALAPLAPAAAEPAVQGAIAAGVLLALGGLNVLGLKVGAGTSDLFSIVKVLPLVLFVVLGLPHVRAANFAALPDDAVGGVASAAFIAVFALAGFEVVPVPAGETANARRTIPIATLGSLLGATLLYMVVQAVAVGGYADLAGSANPLADAARAVLGPAGGSLIAVGAVVSMAGYCAGSAIVVPRYYVALGEDRLLPARLAARDARRDTPVAAIVVSTVASAALAAFLDFGRLVDISNVAIFFQYVPTCLAVLVLRRTRPDLPRRWRLPGGAAIPALATLTSVALFVLARPARREFAMAAAYLAAGALVYVLARAARGRRGDAARGGTEVTR